MIGIVAILRVHDGKGPELEAVMKEMAGQVRAKEPGVLLYQLTRSRTEPNTYKMLELYADQAAHDGHFQTEHMAAARPRFAAIMAARPELEYVDPVV